MSVSVEGPSQYTPLTLQSKQVYSPYTSPSIKIGSCAVSTAPPFKGSASSRPSDPAVKRCLSRYYSPHQLGFLTPRSRRVRSVLGEARAGQAGNVRRRIDDVALVGGAHSGRGRSSDLSLGAVEVVAVRRTRSGGGTEPTRRGSGQRRVEVGAICHVTAILGGGTWPPPPPPALLERPARRSETRNNNHRGLTAFLGDWSLSHDGFWGESLI